MRVWLSVCLSVTDTLQSADDETRLQSSFNSRCSRDRVTDFVTRHVQSAYLKAETNHELHYILPFDEARKGGYERLFTALHAPSALAELHVASYGVADSSLEEVFLKITTDPASQQHAGQYEWSPPGETGIPSY